MKAKMTLCTGSLYPQILNMNVDYGSAAPIICGGKHMSRVKVVEPVEGLAFLSLGTEDGNMIDIPLSYTQDITEPFIQEFKLYLQGKKIDKHLVLNIDGEEGTYLLAADDKETLVIDIRNRTLTVCPVDARDIIKACIANFVAYMDEWARFDIRDTPGEDINYMRSLLDRKGLIESAEDEINPYLHGIIG